MRALRTLMLLAVLVLFALPQTAYAGKVNDVMKAKEKEVAKLLAKPTTKGTEAHTQKEQTLQKTINELFDFDELGMRALDIHWDDITDAQRTDFIATLRALIEKNYLLRITGTTTYQIKWYDEYVSEGVTVVRFKIKSGKYRAAIQFKVFEKAGKPYIFDMLIDDVSLLESYRSQFNKIIKKDGFDKLMEKMKKKLTEMGQPSEGKISEDKFEEEAPAAPAPAAPLPAPSPTP